MDCCFWGSLPCAQNSFRTSRLRVGRQRALFTTTTYHQIRSPDMTQRFDESLKSVEILEAPNAVPPSGSLRVACSTARTMRLLTWASCPWRPLPVEAGSCCGAPCCGIHKSTPRMGHHLGGPGRNCGSVHEGPPWDSVHGMSPRGAGGGGPPRPGSSSGASGASWSGETRGPKVAWRSRPRASPQAHPVRGGRRMEAEALCKVWLVKSFRADL